jgi:hypothetical protein
MNAFKKIIVMAAILPIALFAKTINLDQEDIRVELKNNAMNLMVFPFVIHEAKLSTETPEDFQVTSKNTSLIILPTASLLEQEADLIVWSAAGDAFLVKVNANGKEQKFTFASNKAEKSTPLAAKKFETGKIEKDIKKLIKKAVLGDKIPGYKRVDVKRIFETPDLTMQKEYFYDGGKYRVETWFLENKTNDLLTLDYENFYTNGILSIAFEKKKLSPGQVGQMWLIVNKSTIVERMDRESK